MADTRKQDLFRETLMQAYDRQRFVRFLQELLNDAKMMKVCAPQGVYGTLANVIKSCDHIGSYQDSDGKRMGLFAIELQKQTSVENARSAQRAYIKRLLEASSFDGALAAFYTMDGDQPSDKWRLSLVRMAYGFADGKLSQQLTPAKRYSYLVGKDEPCHTAMERLYPMFAQDEENPTLDTLEEAFSVEAVTKQFYVAYHDKYLELKEYLEHNEDFMAEAEAHGFSSEQFTKKLMGQIVFLYFIQKKGWLGVPAFPSRMEGKEYNNARFFKSKTRPLVERVYHIGADGAAHVDAAALFALTDDEAEQLSKVVRGSAWGDGPKNFMRKLFDSCVARGKNYFDDYLEPLFYEALNVNRGESGFFARFHCRVPFLNGGLFEQMDNYDWQHSNFCIPNEMFSNAAEKGAEADGILDTFDRYNFTMAEDEPMEREVAIDPEMLGKVFENLLDVKDRKSKGAFYTPREIVHYMCQESLANYLTTATGIPEADIRKFLLYGEYFRDEDTKKTKPVVENGQKHYVLDKERNLEMPATIFSFQGHVNRLQELDDLLASVKVADPAVGSGAFLLGMLNEIVRARQTLTAYMSMEMNGFERMNFRTYGRTAYDLKIQTIKNCLFACDIEPSAVDITKLRLWLSIVIDDETTAEDASGGRFNEHTKPRQLPNLECNVICGNSLMDTFDGVRLITESRLLHNQKAGTDTFFQAGVDNMLKRLITLQGELFGVKDHESKLGIKREIQDIYDRIILHQIGENPQVVADYEAAKGQASKPFVLWQLQFPGVFVEKGGFDLVIGNPPYIGFHRVPNKEYNKANFVTADGKYDFYVLFIEQGVKLLHEKGMLSYICPSYFYQRKYGKNTRKMLLEQGHITYIADFQDSQIFESALTYTCIFGFVKGGDVSGMVRVLDVNLDENKSHEIPQTDFKEPGWRLTEDPIVAKVKAKAQQTFGGITKAIPQGIVTGSNEAFLIDESTVKELQLETEYLHKAYKGRDIKGGQLLDSHQLLFYPYELDAKGKTKAISEETFIEKAPNLYAYVSQFKEKLSKRSWFQKSTKQWFELWNSRKMEHFFHEKFVFSEIGLVNDFVLANECFYTDSACGAELKDAFADDTNYLRLYLNSDVATYVYKQISVPKANGYSIYKKAFLEGFNIILPEKESLPMFEGMTQAAFNDYIEDAIGLDDDEKQRVKDYIASLKGENANV